MKPSARTYNTISLPERWHSFPKLMSYSHLKCHRNVINDKKVGKTRLVDLIAIVGFYTLALTDMRRWEMRSLLSP